MSYIMKRRQTIYVICCIILMTVFSLSSARSDGTVSPGEAREFSEADDGFGTPRFDGVLRAMGCSDFPEESRAEAFAILALGALNMTATGVCSVFTDFEVTSAASGAETVLDATVSAEVEWKGFLFGATFLGTGASVTIEMTLLDMTVDPLNGSPTGQMEVFTKSQEGANLLGLDIGGTRVIGTRTVSFPGKVVRGHDYAIALTVTCEAGAGAFGADVGCIFLSDVLLDAEAAIKDRFVKWNTLFITVEQDLAEQLDQLDTKLDEVIRLLHTPEGQRSSDVPACDGSNCTFPDRRR